MFGLLLCQVSEYEIIEISENVCNLKKGEADWILKIDIVERGDKLEVRKNALDLGFLYLFIFIHNIYFYSCVL